MPNENKKSELKWPPEKTFKYSITEREKSIEDGEYLEIPIVNENERQENTR